MTKIKMIKISQSMIQNIPFDGSLGSELDSAIIGLGIDNSPYLCKLSDNKILPSAN